MPCPAGATVRSASITRRDALDLIDKITARGAEIQANRTLARLRALFNWAIEKDRLGESPGRPNEAADQGTAARPRAD